MSMIEQKQKNGASILVVVIALILVVIALGGSAAYILGPKTSTPKINQAYVAQAEQLKMDFNYADKREKESMDKLLEVKPGDPALESLQGDVKRFKAKKVELQKQWNDLVVKNAEWIKKNT